MPYLIISPYVVFMGKKCHVVTTVTSLRQTMMSYLREF